MTDAQNISLKSKERYKSFLSKIYISFYIYQLTELKVRNLGFFIRYCKYSTNNNVTCPLNFITSM